MKNKPSDKPLLNMTAGEPGQFFPMKYWQTG
jgi:hypothetical protein